VNQLGFMQNFLEDFLHGWIIEVIISFQETLSSGQNVEHPCGGIDLDVVYIDTVLQSLVVREPYSIEKPLNVGTTRPNGGLNVGTTRPDGRLNVGTTRPNGRPNVGTTRPNGRLNVGITIPNGRLNVGITRPIGRPNVQTTRPNGRPNVGITRLYGRLNIL